MPHTKLRLSLIIIIALCLSPYGFAQNEQGAKHPASASLTDESVLRAATEAYFAAYAKKDLEGMMRLWSAKSPEFEAQQKKMQELFVKTDKIEVRHLNLLKTTTEGEQTKIRVAVEISAIEGKTGKPVTGFGKMNRTVSFIKEEGAWKVWRELAAEEDLAARLIDAKSDDERAALLLAEKELVTPRFVRAVISQGWRLGLEGNYPQALAIYALAQNIAEQIDDKSGIAAVLMNIGTVSVWQGDFDSALEYYQKSLTLRGAGEADKLGIAAALGNIGSVHSWQGNYSLALEYYQKSLALEEAMGDKGGIAATLNNIGHIHRLQGNYGLAMDYFQKSLTLRQPLGDKVGTASTLLNIGIVHSLQSNYSLAEEFYQKSLKLREAVGNKAGIALTLNSVGLIHYFQGNHDRALENYQKSLKLREELGDKPGIAQTLNNIANTYYAQGSYQQALESAERGIAIAKYAGLRESIWRSLIPVGKAHRALNRPAQARQAFDEAIAIVETLRAQVGGGEQQQQRFFEDKLSPYYEITGLLIAQNKIGEAFAYAERAKARVLLDVLRSGRVNITKAMTPQEQEQERRLKSELTSLNTKISRENLRPLRDQPRLADFKAHLQKTRLDYEAFQTSLYASHPELKVQRGEVQPMSGDEAGALLADAKSALLEYIVTDEKTFLFVLTKSRTGNERPVDLKVYTLEVKRKDLTERAERFRQQLARRDLGFAEPARELYDLLLGPAREQLQGKNTLVIVPDAALWELPFQALQTAQNRYLIEDQAISYAPSLTVLREMMRAGRKGPNSATDSGALLAFGNPALGKQTVERALSVLLDEKLDPLPEAEKQVKALGQLYGATQSKVYIGAAASEERVKSEAGKYRVLQLATHGILNDASPMYSHVVLAQGDAAGQEDGLLEAWEIMNLDLKADLVVLSACETARGRVGAGEGVIGLTWALFVAGSPTTVVSQWKVESASTTELMLAFHRNLRPTSRNLKSRVPTAKALQEAAKGMLRSSEYRHPFYWAGFVVVGDGR